jgi:hypothetical protein
VGAANTTRGGQSSPSPSDARASGSGYDAAANRFDLLRPLPDGATQGIRLAVIRAVGSVTRPHLLDLGAGAGRIGRTFVAAGDDYLGVDLSFSMLGAFLRSTPHGGRGRRVWFRLTAEPCRFATPHSTLS